MSKIPRDVSGRQLARLLSKYGYKITRETGSHIRLVSRYHSNEHKITIPDHKSLKIGTLNSILNEVANYLKIPKDELLKNLF
ncbi:type II toxin-antitoxin system HicA family toxin [Candidatus Chrysopegis kryptomonas]|uniref:Predicted RNA binding protein YcfA, dsRBD-like fold, HicA-like mRNA interferase family n=1 Tax=Candidatus Chryseopegocella kryptomonas TaxID=1633643 RepID=A0A0P1NUR8_9BACT|nr:type II toxin-antitoxin system HicA family toxin [Candidatus Chrysopegis kryptomonas]CUT02844.1 Predicted RNA binding protein YcfA, dsRBD-like fold, HicA-like mRNA interferase family [Candidatus Chrysopegis kryptomonas]